MMKTSGGAVGVLALAVLLGGARADSGASDACNDDADLSRPKMTVNNAIRYFSNKYRNAYQKSYGNDIIVHCSAKDSLKLGIEGGAKSWKIKQVDNTTIRLRVKKPDVGEYIFTCVDRETGCKDYVEVQIGPAMSVRASKVSGKDGVYAEYFVRRGDEYQVYCTANAGVSLQITPSYTDYAVEIEVVNDTTIKHNTVADSEEKKVYCCKGKEIEIDIYNCVSVYVDCDPQAEHFYCFIDDLHIIDCSWSYSRDGNLRYELSLIDDNEEEEASNICCISKVTGKIDTCQCDSRLAGHESFTIDQTVSLSLNICNTHFCNNQVFHIKTNAVIKSAPVSHFEVYETGSRVAQLYWEYPYLKYYQCRNCEYKLQYRLKTDKEGWRQVDLSAVHHVFDHGCKFYLALPFPDTKYQLRIFAKLKEAPDALWSEPWYEFAQTKLKEDCECKAASEINEKPTSVEEFSCKLCALIEHTTNANMALKNKLEKNLKEKKRRINDISKLLANNIELQQKLGE